MSALRFAAANLDAERQFLSALWHDPVAAYNTAAALQLSGDSFATNDHANLYAALMAVAESPPDNSIQEVARICAALGTHFPPPYNSGDLVSILTCTASAAGVIAKARRVRAYALRREAHTVALACADALLGPLREDFA